jgi:tetratricopeptide (TPR) repeat protein
MALSEIEKLERRYAENPQGLTFAPLAEVLRKNGDVPRALELLKPGLALHPDYTPASIVLGRCHLDLGELPAAEAAFSHVLELDGENVIALKALADIGERLHRFDDAERWLRQLLSVDRSNDLAREQLDRVELARTQTATASVPSEAAAPAEFVPPAEVDSPAVAEPVAEAFTEVASSLPPPPFEPPAAVAEPPEPAPLLLEDLEPAALSPADLEPPPEGLELDEPASLVEPVEPLSGLIGRDLDAETPLDDEFSVETSEDIVLRSAGGAEFQMPNASEELFAQVPDFLPFGEVAPVAGAPPDAPLEENAPEVSAPVEAAAEAEPATPTPATADIPPLEPELVVTETMAEVLLNQGHPSEALRVYRELENRSTGDTRLRQKIAELEAQTPPVRRAYSAGETKGRPVREFLRDMLAARPPALAAAPAARPTTAAAPPQQATGSPTRPAAEALSLSSVFGDETTPSPPAVPAAGGQESSGVSFDEFFASPAAGGAPRASRAPDPKNDDLDQFHTWLQNLKR